MSNQLLRPAAERLPQRFASAVLWTEFAVIFLLLPAFLTAIRVQRPVIYMSLWIMAAWCAFILNLDKAFSWQKLWRGLGWSAENGRNAAVMRFLFCTMLVIGLLAWLYPEQLFNFPRRDPLRWMIVMVVYPLLSVAPQEFIFRSYFLRRYARLFPGPWLLMMINSLCFGYMHIVMQNWVAPTLSLIGSFIFVCGYRQHQSLKWALIEHAAYGCMIFTAGLGWFFFRGFH